LMCKIIRVLFLFIGWWS